MRNLAYVLLSSGFVLWCTAAMAADTTVVRARDSFDRPVFAGTFALNGNGEMTGTAWVEESGMLEAAVSGPVAGEDMRGDQGHFVMALPHAELQEILRRYGRLAEASDTR